ncbi:MAG TPA: redoxin domain-containing protein [Candidatus Binatia bacterium]|nr:redoxin domain-containing protein [Candidatus Binatia bacterium]
MVKRSIMIIALLAALLAALHLPLFAQQNKSVSSVHDLLRSVGLSKPSMSLAPDFNLLDPNGALVGLSNYRGKVVLLNFWATWCGPCREEMPSLENLNRSFDDQGLAILAVNQRENAALVTRFMKTNGLNFTTPLDTTGRVAGYYRVYGIPVSYLIDANGQLIGMRSGPLDWATPAVIGVFRKLIGEGNSGGAVGRSINLEPTTPFPKMLRGRSDGIAVRSRQDTDSEIIDKLSRGQEFVPLGKVSGAGEAWYMVKTKSGAVGWVKGGDVEETNLQK